MNPRVTILMPAYNYGRYIEQAVRSAWAQDYRSLELVVVDDGSTDGTWAILERLRAESPLPMKLVLGAHRGVAAALNLGLRETSGEWVSILHADDYYRADKITRQVALLADGSPAPVVVHSEYLCVDEEGRPTGYDSSLDLPPAQGQALRDLLLLRADVRSMTMLFRRSALEAIGGYDESLPVEDWQSILRLAKLGEIRHVPEPLVFRRVHGMNISIGAQKLRTFSFKEIGIDVLREVLPADLSFEQICVLHAGVVLRNAMAQGGWRKALDGLQKCWTEFPSQRPMLAGHLVAGVRSYVWLHGVRDHLPASAVRGLLRLKAAAIRQTKGANRA